MITKSDTEANRTLTDDEKDKEKRDSQKEVDTKDNDTSSADEGPEELSLDHIFELLKNSRRRQTLTYLTDSDGAASLEELAEHIAAQENNVSVEAISSEQRKRVYVGLYQCHLPKMDDLGVIDFEKNRGRVELNTIFEQIEPYIDRRSKSSSVLEANYSLDSDYRQVFSIILLCATTAAAAGIFPFNVAGWGVPIIGLMVLIIMDLNDESDEV